MFSEHKLSVIVAGDLNMRFPLDKLCGSGAEHIIFSQIQPVLNNADIRIVNLENPLINSGTPIQKAGPNLKGPENGISLLTSAGFDAAILANNHIGDYGQDGVLRTLELLDEYGIGHTGAGSDLTAARKPWISRRKGRTLAVLAAAENEFGMAGRNKPGSYGFNIRMLCNDIAAAKQSNDFVMVVMHGGNEYCPFPAPVVVDRYRMLIDAGSDAVIGMHPHCPQGYEYYNNRPIVYSTGNFLFCKEEITNPKDPWYHGYLPCVIFDDESVDMRLTPYRFSYDGRHIHMLRNTEENNFMQYLERLSHLIEDPEKLWGLYEAWCVIRTGYATFKMFDPPKADTATLLGILDSFSCEAHQDLIKTCLRIYAENRVEECSLKIPDVLELQKIP